MRRIRNYAGRNYGKRRKKDPLSKKGRSARMSRIRGKGTKLEKYFIAALRKSTKRKFLVNPKGYFGKPDIVFSKEKLCIFIDSDFWHGWQFPRWKHLLKTEQWREKIRRNRLRDKKVTRKLKRLGWRVIRVWEHDLAKENYGKLV
jgi:DNA mismatch endonuclease (patch repair protein)